jgi:RimJ/RimL family protein N-acetyltransferase
MTDFKGRFTWLRRRSIDGQESEVARDEFQGGAQHVVGTLVRTGELVSLREHVPQNRAAFQRWYADEEIARLLRHDQRPLNEIQSRGYFDTIILPMSAHGTCYAIHERVGDRLIGTTALTDFVGVPRPSALFRIVIGEKDTWGKGYGTEATRLVVTEAFERHLCREVRLEVFKHNRRAIAAYERVGFRRTGAHVEYVGRERWELHVIEMAISPDEFHAADLQSPPETTPAY